MATTSEVFCDICTVQDRTNLAVKWCPECEEALCTDCFKHHSASKLLKKHATIEITDHQKLPNFVSSIRQSCEEHHEKFQLFCTNHDVACCGNCVVSNHKDCKGIVAITDILENAKTSSTLVDVEEIIAEVRENIEIVLKDRTRNLKNVQSKFQHVKDVVKKTREKLLEQLDKLEKKLVAEIENKESEIKRQTERVLKEMKDKDLKAKEYQEHIKAIKEYGTNLQTFFGTREIRKYVESEEKHINTRFEDGTLNNDYIQFELNEGITRCLSAESFGSLLLTSTDVDVKPIQTKTNAAQIGTVVSRIKSIDDVKVVLRNEFRVSKGKLMMSIAGCDVTSEGKLVFADCYDNKRVVIQTIDGTYINEICVSPYFAFDVSVIDDQKVAVTSDVHKHIQIVNISRKTILTTFNTDNPCDGITHFDGNVIAAIRYQGVVLVSHGLQDNMSITLRKEPLGFYSYITCFKNNIYYTNGNDNSVTCLSQNNEVVWKFIDKTLIQNPRSIATDQHGNVFVSSVGNNSIVVISADGKHGRTILSYKDGIFKAWAMCYDKFRQKLVVTNWSGNVFVFDDIV